MQGGIKWFAGFKHTDDDIQQFSHSRANYLLLGQAIGLLR